MKCSPVNKQQIQENEVHRRKNVPHSKFKDYYKQTDINGATQIHKHSNTEYKNNNQKRNFNAKRVFDCLHPYTIKTREKQQQRRFLRTSRRR
jgi:hypothetical protein